MIQILIAEDDENIAKMIETVVSIGGYESVVCHNGKEAFTLMERKEFDLILLDIMLPDMTGFEIIECRKNSKAPIIFLTAMQDVSDKVKGLKLGAEDYIVKPFESIELLARIEVVLRRNHKADQTLEFEHVKMDIESHICTVHGQPVNLTPREFEVLVFFIRHRGIAISREKILSAVWGYDYEGETRTVDIHIQQIRKKTELKEKLRTIPKLGYRLESENL